MHAADERPFDQDDDESDAEDYFVEDDEENGEDSEDREDEEQPRRRRRDDNEPPPVRRNFSVERYTGNPSFMSWYVARYPRRQTITQELVWEWRRDLEEREEKRCADNEYIGRRVSHPKFKVWFSEHYPEIDWVTAVADDLLTREIADEFDVFIGQPAIDTFCETAFDKNVDAEWPQEFRRWAKEEHGVREPKQVTGEIIDDWNRYNDARNRAHGEKAEIEFDKMDRDEWDAGADEWLREGNRDLTFISNTKAEWAALLQRRAGRIARERAEAERKAEREKAAAVERRRKQERAAELKRIKTQVRPVQSLATSLLVNSDMQENHDRKQTQLRLTWRKQFDGLSDAVKIAWEAYYSNGSDYELSDFYIVPRQRPLVTPDNADAIAVGARDPAFIEFQSFTASVQLALSRNDAELNKVLRPAHDARPALKAWSRSEIIKRSPGPWLIPGIIQRFPVVYGPPKEGKSLWVQKLSVCMALGVPFDGIEVPQGRVLYITRDMGAGARDVQDRCDDIAQRMGFDPAALEDVLLIVDGRVYLNEPASVAALLADNPGQYVAVIIDTLMRCINGSVVQDGVASAALDGVETIQDETGGAVIAVHHSPRGALHLFGSVVLDAALDAQLSVQREDDIVTVKVERVKNHALPKHAAYVYRREGALLVPTAKRPKAEAAEPSPSSSEDRYTAMFALLPDTWTREETARSLVEHLLGGDEDKPATKRQRWHRALEAMERDGRITRRRDGMMHRRPARA